MKFATSIYNDHAVKKMQITSYKYPSTNLHFVRMRMKFNMRVSNKKFR